MASKRYGHHHRRTRADWAPTVNAGHARCWRCRTPIPPPPPGHHCHPGCRHPSCWDLGHDDHDTTVTRGPEHRHRVPGVCAGNRSTAATLGNRKRGRRPGRRQPRPRTPPPPTTSLTVDDW